MAVPTLVLDAVFSVALAGLYAHVARLLGRRDVTTPDARRAMRAFLVWWTGLGIFTLLGGVRSLLGAAGVLDRGVHAALTYLTIPPLVAALGGLLTYLVYIHTGTQRYAKALLVFHVALGVFFFFLVAWMHLLEAAAGDWKVELTYEHELTGPLQGLVALLLLGPVLAASLAYFGLAFRVHDRTARFRILTVSLAFILWFGSAALATSLGWSKWSWWPLVSRLIGVAATLLVLLAYQPPRFIRARLAAPEGAAQGGGEEARRSWRLALPEEGEGRKHG